MSKNPSKAVDELYRHNNSHDGRKLPETDDFKMMNDQHLLTDKVLAKLSTELKNEWPRLVLLLGLPSAQVNAIKPSISGVRMASFHALFAWRNSSEGSAEEKTRKLITSLREDNVGREDLALMLEHRLAERESSPECSSDGSLVEEGKSSSTKNEKSLISVSNRSDHTDNTEITDDNFQMEHEELPSTSSRDQQFGVQNENLMFSRVNQRDPITNAAVANRQNDEDENNFTPPVSVPAIMMTFPKGTSATDDQLNKQYNKVPPTGNTGPETNPEIKKAEYVAFGPMNVTKNYYPRRKYQSVTNRSRTTNTVPRQVIPLSLHNPQTVVMKVRGQDGLKASAHEIRNLVTERLSLRDSDISEFYRYKDPGRWYMELQTAGLYDRLHGLSFHSYTRKYSVDLEHLDKERHRVEFSWVPPNMSNDQLAELVMEKTKVECLKFIKVKESSDIRVTMIQRDDAEMLPDYINFVPSDGTLHTIAVKVYGRQTKRSNENDDAESDCESMYSTGTSNTESTALTSF